MSETAHHIHRVSEAEAGQKLLQYLTRRLGMPHSVLHRWIRTGQVRVNGHRRKPFDRVVVDDAVRVPPFVPLAADAPLPSVSFSGLSSVLSSVLSSGPPCIAGVSIVYADDELLICHKPAGLPVHGGTGHNDSLAARLHRAFGHTAFAPTPAHRLDKDTSGLICVALSYTRLRALNDALREGHCVKEYVAWVEGDWPYADTCLLEDNIAKRYIGTDEKMRLANSCPGLKHARCLAACVRRIHGLSLLHLRLITGRTHQLRAQCTAQGHPVCGDIKYGARALGPLRLHAARLMLPFGLGPDTITCLPDWEGDFAVQQMPVQLVYSMQGCVITLR